MQLERNSTISGLNSKYRPNYFTYDVQRDVYNEENFQQEHRRKLPFSGNGNTEVTHSRHHIQCRCSWYKFLRCMFTIFPFLEWMCMYRFRDWLLGDLLAGINVGLVQLSQGLMLSLLARQLIPPLNIAYAAFCSSIIYAIFGSCHQMSIGPYFLVSALLINVLQVKPFNGGHLVMGAFVKYNASDPSYYSKYSNSLGVVAATTFLTGIIQLSMSILGFGFFATYLTDATVSAYLAAVALHIMLSQVTCIFGIMISFHAGPIAFFFDIINYCIALPKANSTSILLFLTTAVAMRTNKCVRIFFRQYPIEFPIELFLILGFSAVENKMNMTTENSEMLVDMIPYSFLFPEIPDFSILRSIILQAISLSFVSAFLLMFLSRKTASFHNYRINSNQDLVAIGICNVVSSFFRSCVFTGDAARTIIQDKSGGRQQFASLVGASVMLFLMVKVGHFFYKLPNAVLAAIILINVLPYLKTVSNLPIMWRQDKYDCVIWMVTFFSAIFLGLDLGLLVSLIFSFFIITVRSHRIEFILLGQIPNTNIYRSINDCQEVMSIPGVKIFQCCNAITFINVYRLKHKLLKEVNMIRVREEVISKPFNQGDISPQEEKICGCYCDCDDLEPLPRIVFTERFENKLNPSASSIDLIHCSGYKSVNSSLTISSDQAPHAVSSTSQKMQKTSNEEMEQVWVPNNTYESQGRIQPLVPSSSVSLQPSTHTIILDFSMVHYVDPQGLEALRQMCIAFQNANILVLITECNSSVIRTFERNDFFGTGITKSHLFLSIHDAVLFAWSKKFRDSSELSLDESETVIQESYSEADKNDNSIQKMSSSFLESPKKPSVSFSKIQEPTEEKESELNLNLEQMLESEQESGLDLDLLLDLGLKPETKPETKTETKMEMEPASQPRSMALSASPRHYWPVYMPSTPTTQPQGQPQTRSVEERRRHMDSYLSEGNYYENSWEAKEK
ncbi:testis anion transporter 1 [Carlito syrichta]|uniref:Testis anion transporter 1 n=1 Tax=Carlito syrichta TaxID=1868482 RepID=A0A3Q0E292_CARSF|nr:testis anion transporter 1 [Carlito syrichta]